MPCERLSISRVWKMEALRGRAASIKKGFICRTFDNRSLQNSVGGGLLEAVSLTTAVFLKQLCSNPPTSIRLVHLCLFTFNLLEKHRGCSHTAPKTQSKACGVTCLCNDFFSKAAKQHDGMDQAPRALRGISRIEAMCQRERSRAGPFGFLVPLRQLWSRALCPKPSTCSDPSMKGAFFYLDAFVVGLSCATLSSKHRAKGQCCLHSILIT